MAAGVGLLAGRRVGGGAAVGHQLLELGIARVIVVGVLPYITGKIADTSLIE